MKYGIMVQTGNEHRSGTNANVFITIYGTNGDSGKRQLTQSRRDLFERNQKDNFELEAVDLGKKRLIVKQMQQQEAQLYRRENSASAVHSVVAWLGLLSITNPAYAFSTGSEISVTLDNLERHL